MINNLDTPSSEVQINFGVLQIDSENSATGIVAYAQIMTVFFIIAVLVKTLSDSIQQKTTLIYFKKVEKSRTTVPPF